MLSIYLKKSCTCFGACIYIFDFADEITQELTIYYKISSQLIEQTPFLFKKNPVGRRPDTFFCSFQGSLSVCATTSHKSDYFGF
jgi:hypothetical protein